MESRQFLRCWSWSWRSAPQANAGVDNRVEDVDHQVDDDDHGAAHQHDPLDHREVAECDALVEQSPDPGPCEHDLDDGRHIDHDDEVDTGQCQHWDQRVLERVLGDHQHLRQTLEPGELDIFRAQYFEHRGP